MDPHEPIAERGSSGDGARSADEPARRPSRLLCAASAVFDRLDRAWHAAATQRRLAGLLVVLFVGGLAVIELRRRGWLPHALGDALPTSHFFAVQIAFDVLLLAEVLGLIFALARSVANAAGKQFEIMSLILLRQSFIELAHLSEPLVWEEIAAVIPHILSDGVGALLIFVTLGVYYRLQRHRPITEDVLERGEFVATKKLVALLLLVALGVIGVQTLALAAGGGQPYGFFEAFYTLLIFADVLIVLISLRHNTSYAVVFRYFGFALATVLIRLALTAPRIVDAALGLGATLFAVALTWAFNRYAVTLLEREEQEGDGDA